MNLVSRNGIERILLVEFPLCDGEAGGVVVVGRQPRGSRLRSRRLRPRHQNLTHRFHRLIRHSQGVHSSVSGTERCLRRFLVYLGFQRIKKKSPSPPPFAGKFRKFSCGYESFVSDEDDVRR